MLEQVSILLVLFCEHLLEQNMYQCSELSIASEHVRVVTFISSSFTMTSKVRRLSGSASNSFSIRYNPFLGSSLRVNSNSLGITLVSFSLAILSI